MSDDTVSDEALEALFERTAGRPDPAARARMKAGASRLARPRRWPALAGAAALAAAALLWLVWPSALAPPAAELDVSAAPTTPATFELDLGDADIDPLSPDVGADLFHAPPADLDAEAALQLYDTLLAELREG